MSCFWSQNQKNNKNNIKFLGTNIFLAAGGNLVSFSILVRFELISSTQRACSLQHVFAFVGNSVYMRFHYTERVSLMQTREGCEETRFIAVFILLLQKISALLLSVV